MSKSVQGGTLKAETATSKDNGSAKYNALLHRNCGILNDQCASLPTELVDAKSDTEKESLCPKHCPKHLDYYSQRCTSTHLAPKSNEPHASSVRSLTSTTTGMTSSASSFTACSISVSAASSIKRSFDKLKNMDLSCNDICVPPESIFSAASEMNFKEWSQVEKDAIVDFAKKFIINQEAISREYGDCPKKKRREL